MEQSHCGAHDQQLRVNSRQQPEIGDGAMTNLTIVVMPKSRAEVSIDSMPLGSASLPTGTNVFISFLLSIREAIATETPKPEFSHDRSVRLVAAGRLAIMR